LWVWENHVKGIWWMPWHKKPMKDVAACDKPRRGGKQPLTRGSPNGETRPVEDRASGFVPDEDPVNWNILVTGGKEIKRDSLSSGERKGNSPNLKNRVRTSLRWSSSWRLQGHMFLRGCKIIALTTWKG